MRFVGYDSIENLLSLCFEIYTVNLSEYKRIDETDRIV